MAGLNVISVASRAVPAAAAMATSPAMYAVKMGLWGGFIGGVARTLEGLLAARRTPGDLKKIVADAMNERFPGAKSSTSPEVQYVYAGVAEIYQRMLELVAEERHIARQAGWHAVIDTSAQVSATMGTASLFGADAPLLGVVTAGTLESLMVNASDPTSNYYGKRSLEAKVLGYLQALSGPLTALIVGLVYHDPQIAAIAAGVARGVISFVPSNIGVTRDSKCYRQAFDAGYDLLAKFEAGLIKVDGDDGLVTKYDAIKADLDRDRRKD